MVNSGCLVIFRGSCVSFPEMVWDMFGFWLFLVFFSCFCLISVSWIAWCLLFILRNGLQFFWYGYLNTYISISTTINCWYRQKARLQGVISLLLRLVRRVFLRFLLRSLLGCLSCVACSQNNCPPSRDDFRIFGYYFSTDYSGKKKVNPSIINRCKITIR